MNLKTMATVFGVVLLLIGILGFVSPLTPNMQLLGIFQVDMLHNLVHVLTGAAALVAGFTSVRYSKLFFQAFGVVYALVTVLGFVTGYGLIALIPVNMADNLLHVAITAISLYLGFAVKTNTATV